MFILEVRWDSVFNEWGKKKCPQKGEEKNSKNVSWYVESIADNFSMAL